MWRRRGLSLVGIGVSAFLAAATSRVVEIHAEFDLRDDAIVVTNRDSAEWRGVSIAGIDPCTALIKRDALKAGESWTIRMDQFKALDGAGLYVEGRPVRSFALFAQANLGSGTGYGHAYWPPQSRDVGVPRATAGPTPSPTPGRRCDGF